MVGFVRSGHIFVFFFIDTQSQYDTFCWLLPAVSRWVTYRPHSALSEWHRLRTFKLQMRTPPTDTSPPSQLFHSRTLGREHTKKARIMHRNYNYDFLSMKLSKIVDVCLYKCKVELFQFSMWFLNILWGRSLLNLWNRRTALQISMKLGKIVCWCKMKNFIKMTQKPWKFEKVESQKVLRK